MRRDLVPNTNYIIYQNPKGFCYSLDSLLLIKFAKLKGKVCDLGAGTGILTLLATKFKDVTEVVGVEILEEYASLLNKSIVENGLEDRVTVENCNIEDLKDLYRSNYFDAIIMNPPYFKDSLKNESHDKTSARHEDTSLEVFVEVAKYLVRNSGKVYIVYPTHRLADVMNTFRDNSIEPKRLCFIKKNINSEPYAFLMEGAKSGGVFLKIERDYILYNIDGSKSDLHKEITFLER